MKPFESFTLVKQPIEAVWLTMRDRLPAVAGSMDDLEGIELLERVQESEGRVRLVNRWTARRRVPAPLQSALGADVISWLDTAVWDDAGHLCWWRIEPSVLAGRIECAGQTRYEPAMAGRGTRVTFEGGFAFQGRLLEGAAAPLESAAVGFLETLVATMIPRNLARAVAAAGRLIESQPPRSADRSADQAGVVEAQPRVGER